MTETSWVGLFVARMVHLRGDSAEPEAIRLFALEMFPVLQTLNPSVAAEREFGNLRRGSES